VRSYLLRLSWWCWRFELVKLEGMKGYRKWPLVDSKFQNFHTIKYSFDSFKEKWKRKVLIHRTPFTWFMMLMVVVQSRLVIIKDLSSQVKNQSPSKKRTARLSRVGSFLSFSPLLSCHTQVEALNFYRVVRYTHHTHCLLLPSYSCAFWGTRKCPSGFALSNF
jgi:hypothetical protein